MGAGGTLSLALDFGPLLIFFMCYKGAGWFWGADNPITAMTFGTGAFMAAIIVAVVISKVKLGRVSPMLWLSALLILFFGGLTIEDTAEVLGWTRSRVRSDETLACKRLARLMR